MCENCGRVTQVGKVSRPDDPGQTLVDVPHYSNNQQLYKGTLVEVVVPVTGEMEPNKKALVGKRGFIMEIRLGEPGSDESYRTVKEYLVSVQNGDFKFGNEWFDDTEIEIAKN